MQQIELDTIDCRLNDIEIQLTIIMALLALILSIQFVSVIISFCR